MHVYMCVYMYMYMHIHIPTHIRTHMDGVATANCTFLTWEHGFSSLPKKK